MSRRSALLLICASLLFAMSLWFGVSAVAPQLQREWGLAPSQIAGLTLAVQLGFVAGTLFSATFNLADLLSCRRLIAVSAVAGALLNASLALFVSSLGPALLIRFLTGFCLAGAYPPAMKLVASWFHDRRGFALGLLIGALTLGKASPYIITAVGSSSWRVNVIATSLLAAVAATLILAVRDGPYAAKATRFDITQIVRVFSNRGVRLASLGYFGHMWELYAMWTWFPVMLRASVQAAGVENRFAEVGSFLVIASGAIGCAVAGLMADRIGRTTTASAAMIISGASCIAVGFAFDEPLLLLLFAVIWGATVVADSAQFSACVTELADPQYVGTALTTQTAVGFLLTTLSIELIPRVAEITTWKYAFVFLAPGPLLGTLAMMRLRTLPEASRIANGAR